MYLVEATFLVSNFALSFEILKGTKARSEMQKA
jgi:hypothetical protein